MLDHWAANMMRRFLFAATVWLIACQPLAANTFLGNWCPGPTITYVGGASSTALNGGNVTVSLTGITDLQEDDLVVVFGVISQDVSATCDADITTSGYTEEACQSLAGGSANEYTQAILGWKFMGATVDTSVTVQGSGDSSDGSVALVHAYRGVDQSTPNDVTVVWNELNHGASAVLNLPDPPQLTTVTDGAMIVAMGGAGVGSMGDATVLNPIGYSNQVEAFVNESNDTHAAMMSRWQRTAGAINPSVIWGMNPLLSGSIAWQAATLALRPAGVRPHYACTYQPYTYEPGETFDLSFSEKRSTGTDASTQTYTTVDFGDEASAPNDTRFIYVGVGGINNSGFAFVDAVTVGGNTARYIDFEDDSSSPGLMVEAWVGPDTTGSTGTVFVDLNATHTTNAIGVWSMRWADPSGSTTCSDNTDTSGDHSCALTMASTTGQSFVICYVHHDGTTGARAFDWNGTATERIDGFVQGNATDAGADNTTGSGSTTFELDATGDSSISALLCTNHRPGPDN